MRLALFSDIHGNRIALDAVLADIAARGGVDAFWVLGDLVAIGPDPVGVLERLEALPDVRYVRGNTDRYVTTGDRPAPHPYEIDGDLALLSVFREVNESFAWTQGALTATGRWEWLATLPREQRITLPDGTRLLGVHASPGKDDGIGLRPDCDPEALRAALSGCGADVVCAGHTHWPLDRMAGAVRAVNLGSVSNPWAPDPRASYVLLEAGPEGYRLTHRRVDYDRPAVIAAMERMRHPSAAFVARLMRGEREPFWRAARAE